MTIRGKLQHDISLDKYTSWRVGGKAKQLFLPADVDDLQVFLQSLPKAEPLFWLGLGSNILIRDGGLNATVILTQGALNTIEKIDDHIVRGEAGVACAQFARACARMNLVGAEFLAGIPGTIGGALCMNAGCFDGETWDWISAVETIDRQGNIHIRTPEEFKIAYRHVESPMEEWFIAGHFRLQDGDKQQSLDKIKKLLQRRADTQPTGEYNCGSVFRNPNNDYAARLIESCGLKGHQVGGAHVSEKHANFIINGGQATAAEIEQLITYVQQQVEQQQGVSLHREVHIYGEE